METVPFVLQKHLSEGHAGTHFDLRIRYLVATKRLASWALPKAIIPTQSGQKVLAVRTPDHSMKWLKFSGKLDSDYGRGRVTIVQHGFVKIIKWTSMVITFGIVDSKKTDLMRGNYSLFRYRKMRENQTWLFFKSKDQELREDYNIISML